MGLIDTTLREGEQMYGVYFREADRRKILLGLAAIGVEEAELGCVGQAGLAERLAWAREAAPGMVLGLWSPCREKELREAARLDPDRCNIGLPVSEAHREKRLGLSRRDLLKRLGDMMRLAREEGLRAVSVGLEDVSRAEPDFALEAACLAESLGARRIRLSDTVGLLSPCGMAALTRRYREALSCALAVHCHNDFGMATANAVSALEAGADFADVSVLGIGERAGIAALEEVAAYLAARQGRGYRLEGLRELCRLTAEAARIAIPRHKPLAGADIFACESGLHVHGLAKDPRLFEPFAPEALGDRRRVGVGKKSGAAALGWATRRLGLALSGDGLAALALEVRKLSEKLGRPLAEGEIEILAKARLAPSAADG